MARIRENSLFQDLSSEMALVSENMENSPVSLNGEKIRKNEVSEESRLRKKADSDRRSTRANDRNKYYELVLARDDKTELKVINNRREQYAFEQTAALDSGLGIVPG